MRKHIHIHLYLSAPPWVTRCAGAAFLFFASAGDLGSESVTLTTYYPSPAGVYAKMLTTQNAYLATSPGSRVGIGTTDPAAALDVAGNMQLSGAGPSIAFNGNGPMISASGNTLDLNARGRGTGLMTFGTGGVENMRIDGLGRVGIGTRGPGAKLDVAGSIRISNSNCLRVAYGAGVTMCPPGMFATYITGIYAETMEASLPQIGGGDVASVIVADTFDLDNVNDGLPPVLRANGKLMTYDARAGYMQCRAP